MKTSNYISMLILAFFALTAQGQVTNTKGSQSLIIKKPKSTGTTRAVIVGVSDYQDENIPDLKYAHKDAEAFAEFLKSPAGGNIASGNVKLFLNEQATGGNVHNALDWLVTKTKKGDQCLIYFSGHGDVETLYENEPGHFLVYDTPSKTYQVNSLRVEDLKKVVTKLSNETQARVTVITDACRSGKLAGSDIKGVQATAQAFLNQFANEIKIMSCQADEFSYEGEQWGGGRGMFSYHMINGLIGMADGNEDKKVNVKELQRHLEDQFEADEYDDKQTPVFNGDRKAVLAKIDDNALMALQNNQTSDFIDTEAIAASNILENDPMLDFYNALKANALIDENQNASESRKSAVSLLKELEESGKEAL